MGASGMRPNIALIPRIRIAGYLLNRPWYLHRLRLHQCARIPRACAAGEDFDHGKRNSGSGSATDQYRRCQPFRYQSVHTHGANDCAGASHSFGLSLPLLRRAPSPAPGSYIQPVIVHAIIDEHGNARETEALQSSSVSASALDFVRQDETWPDEACQRRVHNRTGSVH